MSTSKREKSAGASDAERARKILAVLRKVYPDARPLLDYRSPWELLMATILAAQCTDERVNRVTPVLFAKYPGPAELAAARIEELEEIIRPTGFFRNKAKLMREASRVLHEEHNGRLPDTIDELTTLKGVGRKTANVIIGHSYGKPAIVVDTHFGRVTGRLGLTTEKDPVKIERDLRALVPEPDQTVFSDVVNWHGRYRCKARKPLCLQCEIAALCPFPDKTTA
ncbi:MAG: endonuclease III [Spirochaetales bacterium]|nr:endonuclease III [Spirochaetales bacterium]